MARAIAALTGVVLLSITGVLLHLWLNRPTERPRRAAPRPLMSTERDGSLYDMGFKYDQLERRLMDSERRAERLAADVAKLQQVQTEMSQRLAEQDSELRLYREGLMAPFQLAPEENSTNSAAPGVAPGITDNPSGGG